MIASNGIEMDPLHVPPGLACGEGLRVERSELLIWSGRDGRPSFDIFVVCSTLIVGGRLWLGAKILF